MSELTLETLRAELAPLAERLAWIETDARDVFGPLLEKMQSDMRTLRDEQAALQAFVATRLEESDTLILERMAALGDRIERRLDQTERSIEERLARIEAKLA